MKSKIFIFSLIAIFGIAAVAGFVVYSKQHQRASQKQVEQALSSKAPESDAVSATTTYATYEAGAIKFSYPEWTKINYDTKAADADKIKIAVSSAKGCSFFLKVKDLPKGETLQAYTDKVIKDLGSRIAVKTSEVKDGKASLDAEINMGNGAIVRNVSRVFQAGNTIYSLAFLAEKNAFPSACDPFVNPVVDSVVMK